MFHVCLQKNTVNQRLLQVVEHVIICDKHDI